MDLKTKLDQSMREGKYKPTPKKPNSSDQYAFGRDVTIWFNAWKYDSTEQVWAGLADSIVRGVADHLDPVERKWFYLCLNLARRDIDSIRSWITGRTVRFIW